MNDLKTGLGSERFEVARIQRTACIFGGTHHGTDERVRVARANARGDQRIGEVGRYRVAVASVRIHCFANEGRIAQRAFERVERRQRAFARRDGQAFGLL